MGSVISQGISKKTNTNPRIAPPGSPVKKTPSKLVYHPFSSNTQSDKSNAMKISGDKTRQKDDANSKDKEISIALQQSLKHIFDSSITEGMRVIQEGDAKQAGIISFSGHAGDCVSTPNSRRLYNITRSRNLRSLAYDIRVSCSLPQNCFH